jgi:hypothetical protein
MLENAKNLKRSKFVRELSLCGSNDHSFKNPSQNNEKIFEVVQIRKLYLNVIRLLWRCANL